MNANYKEKRDKFLDIVKQLYDVLNVMNKITLAFMESYEPSGDEDLEKERTRIFRRYKDMVSMLNYYILDLNDYIRHCDQSVSLMKSYDELKERDTREDL